MKITQKFKKLAAVFAFVFAVAMVVPNPTVITAQAASVNKVTANPNYKKAGSLKKGNNKVTAKKNNSYTKFKAPAAGTYKITISNIKSIKPDSYDWELGNFYVEESTEYGPSTMEVKTNGGKATCMWTANNVAAKSDSLKNLTNKGKDTVDKYLGSRYVLVKLKKGQTVYFEYYYTGESCTYNLKVEKK